MVNDMMSLRKNNDDLNVSDGLLLKGLVILLSASISYGGTLPAMQLRKVAETGMAAPGTEPGVVFGALTTSLNHDLLVPRMDANGRVAFMGALLGPGIDLSNFQGIWAEQDGTLHLVARNGQPAPGTAQGVLFRGVPSLEVPFAPEGGGSRIAFHAQLIGPGVDVTNDEGIWKGGPEGLSLVVREGSTPPGLAGTTFSIPSVLANGAGAVLVRSSILGPGVNESNQEALFSDRNGSLKLLVREGEAAPSTGPGTVFGGSFPFPAFSFNDHSQLALIATLAGPAVDSFNDQALFAERGGALQMVLREGQPAPGQGQGVTFGGDSADLGLRTFAFNNHERLAFSVNLGGIGSPHTALFSDHTGVLSAVAIAGQPAPGTDFNYSFFGRPMLNDANQIAFSAAFPDDDGDLFNPPPFGVFSDAGGSIAPVVTPGDITLEGEVIQSAEVREFNSAGQMLLNIRIDAARIGFWLRNTDGALLRIAATAELFDLNEDGSDVRDVIRVTSGGMNEAGQVAIRLDFADGSSAHFVATPPCPSIACPDGGAAAGGIRPSDFDGDGDVDLRDFQDFQVCFGAGAGQQCLCSFDFDLDCDVGLNEFEEFRGDLTGPQ